MTRREYSVTNGQTGIGRFVVDDKGARAYRKENGELPSGIARETERRI